MDAENNFVRKYLQQLHLKEKAVTDIINIATGKSNKTFSSYAQKQEQNGAICREWFVQNEITEPKSRRKRFGKGHLTDWENQTMFLCMCLLYRTTDNQSIVLRLWGIGDSRQNKHPHG